MYTVRSACESLGISPHRLRKWESRYDLAAAARDRSGRRSYDPRALARLAQMVESVRAGRAPAQAAAEIFRAHPPKRPWSDKLLLAAQKVARTFDIQKVRALFRQHESKFGALAAFDIVWLPLLAHLAPARDPRSQAAFRFLLSALMTLLSPAGDTSSRKFLVLPWPTGEPWRARLWSAVLSRAGHPASCMEGLSPEALAVIAGRWKPQAIILVADAFPPAYARAELLTKFQRAASKLPMLIVGVRKSPPKARSPRTQFLDEHLESTARALRRFVPRGTNRIPHRQRHSSPQA